MAADAVIESAGAAGSAVRSIKGDEEDTHADLHRLRSGPCEK